MIENVATEFGKKYAQNVDIKNPEPGSFSVELKRTYKHFYKGGIYHIMNIINLYHVYNSYKCLSLLGPDLLRW